MKKLVIAVIGVACFGAGNAVAADQYELAYSKQELASHQGVATVHKRVLRTAKAFCPSYSEVRDVRRVRSCVQDVADDLVSKIDHPKLTSYHTGEGDVRVAATLPATDDNS